MSMTDEERILIDLADRDLTRLMSTLVPQQRSLFIFYETFSAAMLAAHIASWQIFKPVISIALICPIVSAGLFAASLLMSVLFMSGANLKAGAIKGYFAWLKSAQNPGFSDDVLKRYDSAIKDIAIVIKRRGAMLRGINLMTVVALVIGAVGIGAMVLW